MQRNLTKGPITVNLLLFAMPLMFGNLLQQLYNVADTWVVGRYLGANALAAVGSSYTLMTFLTSIKGLMKDYLWVIFLGILAIFYIIILPICCERSGTLWYRYCFWQYRQS